MGHKKAEIATTARVVWEVRAPSLKELEGVLTDMSDAGWLVYKLSEPIRGKTGVYFVVVFHKAEIVTGAEAEKLMAARKQGA